jgi:integrase
MGKSKSRANGDGDVFPRKNKEGKITSYRGAYFGPDGKRRYVSGKTKTQAREALAAARAEAAGGVVLDAGKLTVATYLKRWLSDCLAPLVESGKLEHRTFVRYEGIVEKHLSPPLAGRSSRAWTAPKCGRSMPRRAKNYRPVPLTTSTSPYRKP